MNENRPSVNQMKVKRVLIVYGTRFGATITTVEEMAKVFQKIGFDTKIVNLKKEKIKSLAEYDLIIVGSSIMIDRWTKEPEKFLKEFQSELSTKKIALFISSGTLAMFEYEHQLDLLERAKRKYIEAKIQKYNLKPLAVGMFGGIWDYNHMPFWSKKAMSIQKEKLLAAGIKETKPKVYDTRNWEEIRKWTQNLAQLVVKEYS